MLAACGSTNMLDLACSVRSGQRDAADVARSIERSAHDVDSTLTLAASRGSRS